MLGNYVSFDSLCFNDGIDMIFKKQQQIANYTVVFPHKQGSYAETYRVKDSNGKLRFLKLISFAKLNHSQFNNEGRIIELEVCRLLNHPNTCNYVDSGTLIHQGQQYAYIVTEFISGETLAQKIEREQEYSVYETKQVAIAVLEALKFLHSCEIPIIHNEITIQNVMLDLTKEIKDAKLIDFGHARFLNQAPVQPNWKELNPFYLAPECFNGVCSVQSDLYSVGVMMYHLLFGIVPWYVDYSRAKESEQVNVLLAERGKTLAVPNLDLFELDEQLVNTIKKAISQDIEERFQNADEFIKAINNELKIEDPDIHRKIKSEETVAAQVKGNKVKGPGFAAIAGMQELKDILKTEVIDVLHNPEEYARYGLTIPNGMLLYGPPGCGKTFFAKHFAEEVGFNFMMVTPSTLKSRYVNATQENIAKMFKEAEEHAPTIIFIDEMNELVPNREGDVHEMSRSAVNEMLAQMDRTGEKSIFIIGATNYPNMIDPAILRTGRLDKKYYLSPPDKEARKDMFEMYLKERPYDFGLNYDHLAQLTENYVSSDIKMIVDDASRKALKLHSRITMKILEETIKTIRPSVSLSELQKYEKIRAMMNGETPKTENKERPKIGFR